MVKSSSIPRALSFATRKPLEQSAFYKTSSETNVLGCITDERHKRLVIENGDWVPETKDVIQLLVRRVTRVDNVKEHHVVLDPIEECRIDIDKFVDLTKHGVEDLLEDEKYACIFASIIKQLVTDVDGFSNSHLLPKVLTNFVYIALHNPAVVVVELIADSLEDSIDLDKCAVVITKIVPRARH